MSELLLETWKWKMSLFPKVLFFMFNRNPIICEYPSLKIRFHLKRTLRSVYGDFGYNEHLKKTYFCVKTIDRNVN